MPKKSDRRKFVFISGGYSASTLERQTINVCKAVELAKRVMERGHIPIVAHKQTENWQFDHRFKGWTHDDWLNNYCLPLLSMCDAIAFVEGWENFDGSVREWEHANQCGIEILTEFDEFQGAT